MPRAHRPDRSSLASRRPNPVNRRAASSGVRQRRLQPTPRHGRATSAWRRRPAGVPARPQREAGTRPPARWRGRKRAARRSNPEPVGQEPTPSANPRAKSRSVQPQAVSCRRAIRAPVPRKEARPGQPTDGRRPVGRQPIAPFPSGTRRFRYRRLDGETRQAVHAALSRALGGAPGPQDRTDCADRLALGFGERPEAGSVALHDWRLVPAAPGGDDGTGGRADGDSTGRLRRGA